LATPQVFVTFRAFLRFRYAISPRGPPFARVIPVSFRPVNSVFSPPIFLPPFSQVPFPQLPSGHFPPLLLCSLKCVIKSPPSHLGHPLHGILPHRLYGLRVCFPSYCDDPSPIAPYCSAFKDPSFTVLPNKFALALSEFAFCPPHPPFIPPPWQLQIVLSLVF